MSTVAERTILVSREIRLVFISDIRKTSQDRTVNIPRENRLVIVVDRKTTSADRTAYANED